MTFLRNRLVVATAATAVMATWVAPISTANAAVLATPETVYNAVLDSLPPNLPSQAFQAQQTAEFGDHIALASTNRVLRSATVTMSTWAPHSQWLDYPSGTGWQHPITLSIYSVNNSSGTAPELGSEIGSVTQIANIPWRAEHTTACTGDRWSPDGNDSTNCYSGKAFNIEFDLSEIGTVPSDIIYGIAYNTETWGYAPTGFAGPYNSLNVALSDTGPVTGTDAQPDAVFWNTATANSYTDGGAGGVSIFRRDTGWSPWTPSVKFTASATASAEACLFEQSDTSTLTLQSDCQTDQTILVPNGSTLNGGGHTITAVDPVGGHFLGAVVANAGASANVTNLTVTASNLADACDGSDDRLRGILFDNASGSITNNVVTGVRQGPSGCQEGNAIEVRNFQDDELTPASPRLPVTISGNAVLNYQKNGITANGGLSAKITGNTVTGDGPISYTAQNGIQVGFGASATVKGNTVSGNNYTPASYEACGVLLYQASGVKMSSNTLFANERNQCNFGKGGGKVKPIA